MSELGTAQVELASLETDLPKFEALLAENEQAVKALKQNRGDLNKQADTRARVTAARELLEQHKSDITAARAEVARLETEAARRDILGTMVAAAKRAKKHRLSLDTVLTSAVAALQDAATIVRAERDASLAARLEFAAQAETIVPGFRARRGNVTPETVTAAQALAKEAETAGAPLDHALDNALGHICLLDISSTHPLPQGDFARLVYNAVSLLDTQASNEAARLEREAKRARQEAVEQANLERINGPVMVVLDVPEKSAQRVVECLGELVQRSAPINSYVPGVWPSFGVTVLERELKDAKASPAEQLPELKYKVRTDL